MRDKVLLGCIVIGVICAILFAIGLHMCSQEQEHQNNPKKKKCSTTANTLIAVGMCGAFLMLGIGGVRHINNSHNTCWDFTQLNCTQTSDGRQCKWDAENYMCVPDECLDFTQPNCTQTSDGRQCKWEEHTQKCVQVK